MKKLTIVPIVAFIAVAVAFASCKKSSNSTPTPTPTPTSTTGPTPNVGSVDGALISLKMDMTTVTAGFPVTITTQGGLAMFFTSTGNSSTFVDGGAVSVNSNALDTQSNNSYLKLASIGMTPSDLGLSGGANWSVAGAGSVPAFTYSHGVSFPGFTGTVPDSVTRSAGITVTLGSNVSNADSVIVMVAAGSVSVVRTFAGSAATATISASDLSTLPVVSDKSAVMEVVPYRVTLSTQGGKQYAFIKEYAAVKNVNIK